MLLLKSVRSTNLALRCDAHRAWLTNYAINVRIVNQGSEREKEVALMNGQRIRQLRLARGLSLDALAARMGGVVSKQALSKYERGLMQPTPRVLTTISGALGVKAAHLWMEPAWQTEFIAYRKGSGLSPRAQARIENLVRQALEDRIRLQELTGQTECSRTPIKGIPIRHIEDAESAAMTVRDKWDLGIDAIASAVDVLEDQLIHVIETDASDQFDGVSAFVRGEDNKLKAAAVVMRRGVPGERQRLSLVHELGHLCLNVSGNVDEEEAAFRFGTAFLVPAELIRCGTGSKRRFLQLGELLLLKKRFGVSMQALLHRLKDLEIISEQHYRQWRADINRQGWRRREPWESEPEKSQWLKRTVLRALSEGLLTLDEAAKLLGEVIEREEALSLVQRREFMKLSADMRRKLLAEQAKWLLKDYRRDQEQGDLETGDFLNY